MNVDKTSRLTTIRLLNYRQHLASQAPDDTIFNGAMFEAATIGRIVVPAYGFEHPLSSYPTSERARHLKEYGIETATQNQPIVFSIGCLAKEDCELNITVMTREVNNDGYWCLVQRTIHMHRSVPLVSTDMIAPSWVLATDNEIAPTDTAIYRRPADVGPPAPVQP